MNEGSVTSVEAKNKSKLSINQFIINIDKCSIIEQAKIQTKIWMFAHFNNSYSNPSISC